MEVAVAEGCCWLALHMMVKGRANGGPGGWVRSRHRPFTGWKPEPMAASSGSKAADSLATQQSSSDTGWKAADLCFHPSF